MQFPLPSPHFTPTPNMRPAQGGFGGAPPAQGGFGAMMHPGTPPFHGGFPMPVSIMQPSSAMNMTPQSIMTAPSPPMQPWDNGPSRSSQGELHPR